MKKRFLGVLLLVVIIMAAGTSAYGKTKTIHCNGYRLTQQDNGTLLFEGVVQNRAANGGGVFRMVLTNDSPVFKGGESVMNIIIKEAPQEVIRSLNNFNYRLPTNAQAMDFGTFPISDTIIIVEAQFKKPAGDKEIPDFIFKSLSIK